MARYGKFLTEQTTDVEDIMATSDGGEYTDAALRADNWFPIETVGYDGSPNTIIRYTLVDDENGGHIEERYTAQQEKKSYSKLKILLAAQQAGMDTAFIGLLESNITLKYIWDASNTIEDNELLNTYLPPVGQALNKTPEEIKAFLDENCIAD